MTSTRTRRAQRIASALVIVSQLRAHESQCDSVFWARHDSREDRALWLVTPVSHGNREENARDDCNYEVAEETLTAASSFGEVSTRYDAWPGGVIETLLVRADDALALRELGRIIDALSDYPVLDDERCSELEWDRAHPSDHECYSEDEDCPCAVRNHDHTGPDFSPDDADVDGEIWCYACREYVKPGTRAGAGNCQREDTENEATS